MPINLNQNIISSSGLTVNGVYNHRITREGLYLYLDAGDLNSYPGTGTVWYDLSDYKSHADMFGSIIWGTVSGATAFTHSSPGRTSHGYFSGETPSLECTIETWVALSGSEMVGGGVDRGSMVLQHVGGDGIYQSYNRTTYKQSNYWYLHIPQGYHESGDAISKQRWHQIVGVWDNKNMHQWIDGTLTSVNNVVGTSTPNQEYWIGGENGSSRYFAGYMAIVRLYNRALHPYEIAENFQANRGRFGI